MPFQRCDPFQLGTLWLEEPPEIPALIPEVLLLLRTGNIGLYSTSPACPRCGSGASAPRSSLRWQSSSGAGIQGEKQRRRKPAAGRAQDSRKGSTPCPSSRSPTQRSVPLKMGRFGREFHPSLGTVCSRGLPGEEALGWGRF